MKLNVHKPGWSSIVILLFLFAITYSMFNVKYWNKSDRVIRADVVSYYAYLPATFIHKDLSLRFIENGLSENEIYWPEKAPNGNYVIKTSMGMSFLYFPFFMAGHLASYITGSEMNGFSAPYKFFIQLGIIAYLAFGLFFIRKILKRKFTEGIAALTLLLILFGTNLFNYSSFESTMSHAYSFCLIVLFLFTTEIWINEGKKKQAIAIGLLLGIITLVRPTNIIIGIFILLWDVATFENLKTRLLFLKKNYTCLLIMAIFAITVWLPQLYYWKQITGNWFYFSYGSDERFFFSNPEIIRGLFGYRKGWLLYTPAMILSLLGIFFIFRNKERNALSMLIFTIINIYIITSWWCWWYGGSFGNRAFIDSYGILAIPMATFLHWLFNKKQFVRILTITLISGIIILNLFQTRQYYGGKALHWDSMTKEAYWASFGRLDKPEGFDDLLDHPDYEAAKRK